MKLRETNTSQDIRVLVIEDDEVDFQIVSRELKKAFSLVWKSTFDAGLKYLEANLVDIVILDLSLPDRGGIEGLRILSATYPRLPVVVLTGLDCEDVAHQAIQNGAQDYIVKSKTIDHLPRAISYAIERQEIIASKDRAEKQAIAASKSKSLFLANMSHEIRTPMNGVIGMLDLLLEQEQNTETLDGLETIRTSAESLVTIIDDILDFSKIEAGKIEIEPTDFSLESCINNLDKIFEMRAVERDITFVVYFDRNIPDILFGDGHRLKQVLINLLSNAIKFTAPGGGVVLQVHSTGQDDGKIGMRFSVSDTGIGVPAERQKVIFDPFEQADGSTSREFGGTGLGLSISWQLVDMMGSQLFVRSIEGLGTVFSFSLELPIFDSTSLSIGPGAVRSLKFEPAKPMNILLAEDNKVNQKVATMMLERAGHSVTLAENGKQAIEHSVGEDFDLILMDIQMPIIDGYSATAAIRKSERKDREQRVPIVALTAHAFAGYKERCLAAGMDDHLSKPINRLELNRVLAKFSK